MSCRLAVSLPQEGLFCILESFITNIHHRSPQNSIIKLDCGGREHSPGRKQEEDANSQQIKNWQSIIQRVNSCRVLFCVGFRDLLRLFWRLWTCKECNRCNVLPVGWGSKRLYKKSILLECCVSRSRCCRITHDTLRVVCSNSTGILK